MNARKDEGGRGGEGGGGEGGGGEGGGGEGENARMRREGREGNSFDP